MSLRTAGNSAPTSAGSSGRSRSLGPLVAVTIAALIFTVLLVLVRLQWAPLESADHGAAVDLNRLIAGDATAVKVVKAVTWLGSTGVLWAVIAVATAILAIRRRWRLAVYLLVTGAVTGWPAARRVSSKANAVTPSQVTPSAQAPTTSDR